MITKTQTRMDYDGERFLVDFVYSGGGAASLAVRRDDGWHWYDPALAKIGERPVLSADACADPIDAAINSLIARREYHGGPMSPAARAAYADALRHEPAPTQSSPACHYCGQEVDQGAHVNMFGVYQCKQCS